MKQVICNKAALFSILWALIIFVLCATPGQYIPSANWLELLSFDKLVHAAMFFVLTSLLLITALRHNQPKFMIAFYFILALSYGASLEFMQAYYFSNRSADWKDMVANGFGCMVSLALFSRIKRIFIAES